MANLSIASLRGGMNNTDPAIALPDDQCVLAENVEMVASMLGDRRLGTTAVTLDSFLSARDRVTFLFRHLPTADETAAELWALGVTGTTTAKLGRKTTAWSEITISDTPTLTSGAQYRWQAVTLHGKIHFAYKSNVDRLHVWDGTTMRRSGFTDSIGSPTAANSGSGSLAGTRYGRVRFVEVSGSTVVRRSEPGAATTFGPSGTGASITWTRPSLPSEGETHWEIELSTDNANFYRMSRVAVGTSTYSDSVAYGTGYSADGTLSEDIGDYSPLWSARYLTADDDRLIVGGSWENDALASRVGWTPVFNASGDGNDERYEADTSPTKDLDTYKYGPITGLSEPLLGGIWVTKQSAIYRLTRTGQRTAAYDADLVSATMGALHGSLVSGLDESGQPCLYALDAAQGPYRIGVGGIKRCGEDVRTTWSTLNLGANVVCSSVYYPAKKQVVWCIATEDATAPVVALVLHVDKARSYADGVRKGWTIWTGTRAEALAMCLYATNINDNTARNRTLVPFIGLEGNGLIQRCDTGVSDAGDAFAATLTTRPYFVNAPINQFEVRAAAVMAQAITGSRVTLSCVRDFGVETTVTVSDISLAPTDAESDVTVPLDDFRGAEMEVGQFTIADVDAPTATWRINRLDLVATTGQSA